MEARNGPDPWALGPEPWATGPGPRARAPGPGPALGPAHPEKHNNSAHLSLKVYRWQPPNLIYF